MSRNRFLVVAVMLALFIAAGGILIFASGHNGGRAVTFDVKVTGGKTMLPGTLSAHQNDTITINIASDTDGEVHLHDYDVHFATTAGKTVSHTFKADRTCTCDIEWESTSTGLGSLVVSP